MSQPLFARQTEQNESWITVSDLMAGLMMVFLVIAVIYAKTPRVVVKMAPYKNGSTSKLKSMLR